jgi:formamidopyrimidine-DNA glycosylase
MPELPEVETIKRNLHHAIAGQKIENVEVLTEKMIVFGLAKALLIKKADKKRTEIFVKSTIGKIVASVERRGKFLIIKFKNGSALFIHLRMSGQLIFLEKNKLSLPLLLSIAKTAKSQLLPTKHTHVVFSFSDGSKLFYNDVRKFGHIRYVPTGDVDAFLKTENLGPEPLDLELRNFKNILEKYPKRAIKAILLDQNVIAGIGNIYADESLFAAKIHPARTAEKLKPAEIKLLHTEIKKILNRAIKLGGSSLEYYLKTNGASGSFVKEHQVYGKSGKPCPRCGRILRSMNVAGRTSTYCPNCQK